ncbi:MAG TPA: KTSC domain-containing protein [Candidatus Dormibacteraeota bacterium]|nr:KTSC domain-containing protein [Candidatus Dormibacteraeota bacterium]
MDNNGKARPPGAPFLSQHKFARPLSGENLKQLAIMRRVWIIILVLTAVGQICCADRPESPSSQPIISHIPRQRVDLTAITRVGYSKRRHILEIEFANGAVYRYLDVPSSIYRDLMSAESKARFYDFNIKGKYRSVHVWPQIKDKSTN